MDGGEVIFKSLSSLAVVIESSTERNKQVWIVASELDYSFQ